MTLDSSNTILVKAAEKAKTFKIDENEDHKKMEQLKSQILTNLAVPLMRTAKYQNIADEIIVEINHLRQFVEWKLKTVSANN